MEGDRLWLATGAEDDDNDDGLHCMPSVRIIDLIKDGFSGSASVAIVVLYLMSLLEMHYTDNLVQVSSN